jgi:sodium/potassium-transporting ATPase subunit alpha
LIDISILKQTIRGDPADTAVLQFSEESLHKCLLLDETADILPLLRDEYKKVYEIPFSSREKWMVSIIQDFTNGSKSIRTWMLIKGVLFPSYTSITDYNGKSVLFNSAHQSRLIQLQSSEGLWMQ